MAASSTLSLTDPGGSGYGATVTFDDGVDLGNLSISLDAVPLGSGTGLLAFSMKYDVNAYYTYPRIQAAGTDVAGTRNWFNGTIGDYCPCNILANLGGSPIFEQTGIRGTNFVIDHPTESITLDAIAGATFSIFLGFSPEDLSAPGKLIDGVKVLKLNGQIPVIPEPSTAALMLIGLMGLACSSSRFSETRN